MQCDAKVRSHMLSFVCESEFSIATQQSMRIRRVVLYPWHVFEYTWTASGRSAMLMLVCGHAVEVYMRHVLFYDSLFIRGYEAMFYSLSSQCSMLPQSDICRWSAGVICNIHRGWKETARTKQSVLSFRYFISTSKSVANTIHSTTTESNRIHRCTTNPAHVQWP